MKKLNNYFDKHKDFGILILRLVVGWRLIAGTWSYAFFSKSITEVETFFSSLQLPFPLAAAYLSVYAQLLCGILFVIGLWVRPAAIMMIINFTVAIIAAHLHESIIKSFQAWAMLAASFVFLFSGAGNLSLDKLFAKRNN